MRWTLEVVQVPVTDVDRAKAFYAEQVGFAVDHDTANVGDGVGNLDTSVHRAWMHDDRVRAGLRQPLGGEAVARQILARRVAEFVLEALTLHSKHHHHVGAGNGPIDITAALAVGQ